MSRLRVLVTAPYMQPVLERFSPVFQENDIELIVPPVTERMEEDDLLQWITDIDGVISGDDRFTVKVLQSANRLKVISKWGTGIDSIDQDACRSYGIAVCNTPNAFSEPVADTVIGYILCFARNLSNMDRHMKSGNWQKIPSRSLRECTLGVLGVGNVGKAVVKRAVAFGMRVLGHDIATMPNDFLRSTGVKMVDKATLFKESDFLSLNCDLNPTSYHIVSDTEFAQMGPTCVLINTARGPLVDERALIRALQSRSLGGAALDVYENEPLPDDSPLRLMENVMLAPHNANSSPSAWENVHRTTIDNLLSVLKNESEY